MIPTIDLNDEFVKYFDYRIPFRGDAEWGMEHLNGIYLVEFSVEAESEGGISNPAYLRDLDRFTAWLREQPEVTHAFSYTDVVKRLNKNMHGDDEVWYTVPETREMAAQYLLLYELSLPYGLDLNDRISIDKSATRVTASLGNLSTGEIRSVFERAEAWLRAEAQESMWADATSASVMFARISERNIRSMLRGNAVAIVLISIVLMITLRSIGIGVLSLIPNAIPILMTFGLWAILVRQVGMAAATVSATSLGIVVDDTVHFLAKYLRARRENGYDRPAAIRYAFEMVGTALVSTTVILSFGFAVLALSSFRINAQMGLLTMMAIVLALATDLLLLPALLMIGHRSPDEETVTVKSNTELELGKVISALLVGALLMVGSASAHPATSQSGDTSIASAAREKLTNVDLDEALRGVDLTPEERGWAIAARSDRTDRGFVDSIVELQMLLRNAAGDESPRSLILNTLEVPDESVGDRSMIVFDRPADIVSCRARGGAAGTVQAAELAGTLT